MKVILSLLCSLFILTGCSSTDISKKYLTQEPITIETSELNTYWINHASKGSFNVYKLDIPKHNGIVKIKYLIDSNGRVYNPTIVEATPNNDWNNFALHGLNAFQYANAESNPKKVPVIVTSQFHFEAQ